MLDKDAILEKDREIDREKILVDGRPSSGYVWCLYCERTYEYGWYRAVDGLQMCPYSGCDGSTVLDGLDWAEVRGENPGYPEVPRRNVVYPLYPGKS